MAYKILCLSDHANFIGGGEYSFLDLVKNLNSIWQPVVIVPAEGELIKQLHRIRIKSYILPFSSLKPHLLHQIIKSSKKFIRLIKKIDPDIIYANGARSALYSGLLKGCHKKKIIWHCRVAEKALIVDRILGCLCDSIIANAKATAERFHKKYQYKIDVVYNGFDNQRLNQTDVQRPSMIKDNWINILMIARVSKIKRHDIVLLAFEIVAKKHLDAHLILVGSKDPLELEWWEYLQEKTKKSKYRNRIHWIGYKRDVRPWYKAAELLVLTSENEGFGRVLIEAMAMGVPVIASRVGGIPEIITDGTHGILTNKCDPIDTAESINKLLIDINLRDRLSREGKKRAMQFDMTSHVKKMGKLFDSLINAKN